MGAAVLRGQDSGSSASAGASSRVGLVAGRGPRRAGSAARWRRQHRRLLPGWPPQCPPGLWDVWRQAQEVGTPSQAPGAHRARLSTGQQRRHLQAHALVAHTLQLGHHLCVLPPPARLPVHRHDVAALLQAGCLQGHGRVPGAPPRLWPVPPAHLGPSACRDLTAARPPGTTAAMRTGESPRSVKPKPSSPRATWMGPASRQRFLTENTDRGPCGGQRSEAWLGCRTWRSPGLEPRAPALHPGQKPWGVRPPRRAEPGSGVPGRVLTSRWKMSATFTWETLGALPSGLCCVLAEGKGQGSAQGSRLQSPGTRSGPRGQSTVGDPSVARAPWTPCGPAGPGCAPANQEPQGRPGCSMPPRLGGQEPGVGRGRRGGGQGASRRRGGLLPAALLLRGLQLQLRGDWEVNGGNTRPPQGPGHSRRMSGASVASKKSSSRSSSEYLASERCSAWASTTCSRSTLRSARHTACSRSASSWPRMARFRWALPAQDRAATHCPSGPSRPGPCRPHPQMQPEEGR